MREIKFRAWEKKSRIMRLWDWIQGSEFPFLCSDGTNLEAFVGVFVDKNYEVMQYTGLKDKNGKEIYEGDIVTGNYDSEGVPHLSVVKWSTTPYTAHFDFGLAPACHLAEVIGNIYENKELLS